MGVMAIPGYPRALAGFLRAYIGRERHSTGIGSRAAKIRHQKPEGR